MSSRARRTSCCSSRWPDTSLRDDLQEKVPLYAENAIPEVWVIDIFGKRAHVFRDPRDGVYRASFVVSHNETFGPAAFPDAELRLADVLP